jgi:hypothetical protein
MADRDDDERVGYGRPPKAWQFQKGRSGNPSGRPKRPPTPDQLWDKALRRTITVMEDGQKKRLSKEAALAHQTVNAALKGDARARRDVLAQIDRRAQRESAGESGDGYRFGGPEDQLVFATLLERIRLAIANAAPGPDEADKPQAAVSPDTKPKDDAK